MLARRSPAASRCCIAAINGAFIVKALGTDGKYWTRRVADADDFAEANGDAALTLFAASDRARELARGDGDDKPADAPVTLDEALTAYSADLEARAASVENVSRVRYRLPAKLAALPVAMVTAKELARFRNSLLDKSKDLIGDKALRRLMPKSAKGGGRDRAKKKRLNPASVNRLCNGLRAALRLAGANPEAVKALEALPDGQPAMSCWTTIRYVSLWWRRMPATTPSGCW